MRNLAALLVILSGVVVLGSCPLPSTTSAVPGSTPPDAPPEPSGPVVVTDTGRNIAVFIDEDGTRIDVAAEEPDGTLVACAEAFTLSLVDPEPVADLAAARHEGTTADVRAIITGRRGDGAPGIWVVLADRTVVPALDADGVASCRLPESGDRDGCLRGSWGWTYTVTGSATGGGTTIVVGDAVNENGIHRGRWSIEPGTTVGVYWKVWVPRGRHHAVVGPARVIGTLDPEKAPPHRDRWPHGWPDGFPGRGLAKLKFFFLGWYEAYLASTLKDGTSWDAAAGVFMVEGTDQDGHAAVATIDPAGPITITLIEPPTDAPDLLVASLSVSDTVVHATDTLSIGAMIRNAGPGSAPASAVAFYLSADAALDPVVDTLIGRVTVPGLASGEQAAASWPAGFSVGTPGTHWAFAVVDADAAIPESDESNNARSVAVPVYYERIVIDTYRPKVGVVEANTFVSLFGPDGDPTRETGLAMWNGNLSPYTVDAPPVSIAEEDFGNPTFYGCARIDYVGALAPGTYYIRVRGQKSTATGVYAIRVLLTPDESYADWYFDAVSDDSSYENDDNPPSGGVPTNPVDITIGGKVNRALTDRDVDWFKLTLP